MERPGALVHGSKALPQFIQLEDESVNPWLYYHNNNYHNHMITHFFFRFNF
jgi:hypothetical protein